MVFFHFFKRASTACAAFVLSRFIKFLLIQNTQKGFLIGVKPVDPPVI